MEFEIIFSPEAIDDFRDLKANVRAAVRDGIEIYLRHEPMKTSRSRIKRLRGLSRPQFRLRVGDVRIFYDVVGETVEVLAIIPKDETGDWLEKARGTDEDSGSE